MKKLVLPIFIIIGFLFGGGTKSVTSIGSGQTLDLAIKNAQRNAIEQVVGAFIKSSTEIKNYQTVKDEILSKTQGYLESYKVLNKSEKKGSWSVKISAKVAESKLEFELEELNIIRSKIGNPSILVYYLYGEEKKEKYLNSYIEQAIRKINNYLQDRRFRTYNFDHLNKVIKKNMNSSVSSGANMENIKDLADKEKADLFMTVELQLPKKSKTFQTKVIAHLFNTSTGEELGSEDGKSDKVLYNGIKIKHDDISDREINQSVERLIPDVIRRAKGYWKDIAKGGKMYKYFFHDIPKGARSKRNLNKVVKKYAEKSNKLSGTEFEIWYKGTSDELQDILLDDLIDTVYKGKEIDYKIEREITHVYILK